MECSRGSYLFSWGRGRGSLWQIIIYVVFLIGRGLLFISYLRQKEGYLVLTHSQSTGKRRSAIEAGCKGVIMTQNVWACVS